MIRKNLHCSFSTKVQKFMGGKCPATSLSPVTSKSVEISPKSFLTFIFNSFSTLVQNFKAIPSPSSKLLNLNQGYLSKKFSSQIFIKLRLR